MSSKVSIVIIGRNEEHSIGKCIDAAIVAAEQIGGAELIYVDSNSTDSTVEVVEKYGVNAVMLDPRLRASPSAGRYDGSMRATGDYILFLDADTLIYPDFLPIAIEQLDGDETLGGVNGRIDDFNEAGEQIFDVDERSDEIMSVKWLRGPACFYRRDALLNAGSFNPDIAIEEEAELGLRMLRCGWRLQAVPQPMARHTRCYHGNSLESIISTFKRDMSSNRLGEGTRTIRYAFKAGNGLAFCWLRLKTTIIFTIWIMVLTFCFFLPPNFHPQIVTALIVLIGGLALLKKKRSIHQTLLFFLAKILSLVDLLAGLGKFPIKETPLNLRSKSSPRRV